MERVLSSNLQGYRLYLMQLPVSELQQATDANKSLITSPKFWKLGKHKSPVVRRSWFSALAALLHASPFLLEDQGAQVAPAVFGNLDESDPSVLPAVWEATLHALVTIKDCWSHVNCEKMVFPKLWHILRDGGQGNASSIYPNLLPLISKIVPNDKSIFYTKFFSNMLTGLGQKMVQQSSSETSAIVTAYMECFRYVVKKEDFIGFISVLMKEQVLSMIEKCVSNRRFHLTLNPLASQVSIILQSWSLDSKLLSLMRMFWEHMNAVPATLIEQPNPDGAFQSFVEFLILLQNPTKIKKSRKVNFSADDDTVDDAEKNEDIQLLPYSEPLRTLGYQTAHYLLKACHTAKYLDPYIISLLKLSKAFQSPKYFEILGGSEMDFYAKSLQPWLINTNISTELVVELIFLLFKYLETEDKQQVLHSFCQLENRAILCMCIKAAIQVGNQGDQEIRDWLQSSELHQILVELAKEVSIVLGASDKDRSTAWSILKLCFSSTIEGGLVIGPNTVSEILQVFCEALTLTSDELKDDAALESCASFISELTNSLFSQQLKFCQVTLQELLLATFQLCCGRRGLSENARESLQNAWKNGIQYLELSPSDMHKLCEKFSKFAHENFTLVNTQSVLCSAQFISITNDEKISEIFLKLPPKYSQWQNQLENAVAVTDVVNNAYFWTKNKCIPNKIAVDCLFNYINAILFNINLLQELSNLTSKDETVTPEDIHDKLIEAIYALSLCDKVIAEYKNYKVCYKSMVDLDSLKLKMNTLMAKVSKPEMENIMTYAVDQQAVPTLASYEAVLSPLTVQISKQLSAESPMCATFMILHEKNISDEQLKKVLDLFVRWRNLEKWNSIFKDETVETSELLGLLKLLAFTIKSKVWLLMPRQWDCLLCSLACWLQEAKSCMLNQPTNPEYSAILNTLCLLIINIQDHMNTISADDELKAKGPKELLQEWNGLFVPEFYSIIIAFFYSAVENTVPLMWEQFQQRMIGMCLAKAPNEWFFKLEPPKSIVKSFKPITVQEWNVEFFCHYLCAQLHCKNRMVQVTAYNLLSKLVPELVEKDELYRLSEDSDVVNPRKLSCEILGTELSATHAVVETMLMDFSIGDCCIVEPFTDSHLYTQGYLLAWGLMLDLCKTAKSELRYHYSRWFSEFASTNTMLDIVFKLMPDYIVHPFESKANTTPSKRCLDMFVQDYSPSFSGYHTAKGIQQAACWVYKKSLLHLPALVRTWWNDCDVRASGVVERLTSALVSPLVCASEMKAVKVHTLVREVVAVYTVDEVRMELTITLPANHPLGPVKVEGNKPAIDIAKWKQWVMQLTIFLTHQNGSIWDGLMLWKRNLDTKFEGVEECYICYSVLHGSSYQIPKLSCHTCHKKFHSICLYRWFHTSNNSTCPICRNLF
ncbi:hypothetical protein B566_EDAN001308 [Ephemera danica]|nr:hypothetical protein B566_EDAN001308 [Ephemera danica]